jgi:hypothetical protein
MSGHAHLSFNTVIRNCARQTSHALTKREILFAFLRSADRFRFVHEKCASQAYMIAFLKGPTVVDGLDVSI